MRVRMDSAEEILNDLVNRLIHSAGKNLDSVILFGSGARTAPADAVSDLNVLCILKSAAVSDLADIAPVVAWWTGEKRQPAPLFFTNDELKNSADVFAIEFLDMHRHHRILFGGDPIASLHVPMNLHRVQVEHDLRTTILRLRRLFLTNSADSKALASALGGSFSSVRTILRHALITIGEPAPNSDEEVFARVGVTF